MTAVDLFSRNRQSNRDYGEEAAPLAFTGGTNASACSAGWQTVKSVDSRGRPRPSFAECRIIIMSTTTPADSIDKTHHSYRPDIDGLRAIAVVAVILNHLEHSVLPGGYLGVDIFFVISGYVITSSLASNSDTHLGRTLLDFYSSRVRRLVPALIVMTLLTAAAIRLFDPYPGVSIITAAVSLFGLSNIFLFSQAINYFGHSAQLNPFSHTWSLGVEEQFYLLFPFIMHWLSSNHRGSSGEGSPE